MSNQMIFKRYEVKYMLNRQQYTALRSLMKNYMTADPHGPGTIQSLYFDTPDYLLIRHSLEKPLYKEKLRLRSYGIASPETPVFVELKKKYDKGYITKATLKGWVRIERKVKGRGITEEQYEQITGEKYEA